MTTPDSAELARWANPFARACWRDVVTRAQALPELAPHVLLHAGPPLEGPAPAPVRQAAVQALLFEGLALDEAAALNLLDTGAVQLAPAQDHGVATPLAQVVSASMPLAVVGDGKRCAWAPLIEGPAPALRFGTTDAGALQRLRAIAALGQRLAPLLRDAPVPLRPVVEQALKEGDECHARTGAANAALLARLPGICAQDREALAASPGFVLTILMAAAAWRMRAEDAPIAAAGGNGQAFGLRLRGARGWQAVAARPPQGTRFAGHEQTPALGAIGDSAVLDFCGLGGQSLAAAPALCEEWRSTLPRDVAARRAQVCDPATGLVDPACVRRSGLPPLVNLAILGADGTAQLMGRGWYAPDSALFEAPAAGGGQ
ncbi:DUF1116 domain-containing protein [Comamonas endophytica]|uniref:DUF1116 domain-containing protein n=1 Tax=Comamonas endophytica TaxID=2949090 RepID=A0ABY6G6A6_9BURK|nr:MULTISPECIES: DUF1116 domain-containing protein [unclassified Acidovorax]MCD2511026.1 DUF1116 domain-containing protein [Acidovorax sp. D4N7]UYG50433.1 DUF1116 domain-containing protein [Acidovorax sp. 5MLIR]